MVMSLKQATPLWYAVRWPYWTTTGTNTDGASFVLVHFKYCQCWPKFKSPWASYQIRKIADAHAPGMTGTFSLLPGTSDSDMHHGTCVTHVPWCMPGSLTSVFLWIRWRGKTFPAFPAHAQPAILRIWQEAHMAPLGQNTLISVMPYGTKERGQHWF